MKRTFLLIIAFVASITFANAAIVEGTCGDNLTWSLNTEDSTLTIKGSGEMSWETNFAPWNEYRSFITYVSLPCDLTNIYSNAFNNCRSLISITIPDSVSSIGVRAFLDCSDLTSIEIPNGVTSIGKEAFSNCSCLTSVTIPNSVTSINEYTFSNCYSLTSVTIPNSVTDIGYNAFSYVPNVEYAGMASGSPWGAKCVNGYVDGYFVYRDAPKTSLAACSAAAKGEITIPDGVISIGSFSYCSDITSVIIPNSVTSIGDNAFCRCTGLTKVTIPNSVKSIGAYAFTYCTSLTSVEIPNSVTRIQNGAFSSCSSLTSVSISDSVTSIDERTFYNCSSLTSVYVGNSVTNIGTWAFSNCSSLISVNIPNSVTSIGERAFYFCCSLTSINIPNSVTSIGTWAFYYVPNVEYFGTASGSPWGAKCVNGYVDGYFVYSDDTKTSLVACSAAAKGEITIPNSVTSIGKNAFYGCTSLTSVIIPNSVTSIGSNAFQGVLNIVYSGSATGSKWGAICMNGYIDGLIVYSDETKTTLLRCSTKAQGDITIPNSVTSIVNNAFYNCSNLISISIPNSLSNIGSDIFYNCTRLINIYVDCGDLERVKLLLNNDSRVKYAPLPYSITVTAENGQVCSPQNTCDYLVLTAIPNYGYHFTQWSDGITDNPRFINLTQDTTFAAVFSPNNYSILDNSNPVQGYIDGVGVFDYLTQKELNAIANYGYHFTQWSDGITDNPRTIILTQDTMFSAEFAKNTYTIVDNSDLSQGHIEGIGNYEYLDEISLTIVTEYGYHFNQWSDGITDNPRTITLTQDTTFTAEFAIDKSGVCGKDNALTWSFDDQSMTLSISGNGALDENFTYGLEAPMQMKKLIIGNEITVIGDSAFFDSKRLMGIYFGEAIETIGNNAFRKCPYIIEIHAPMEFPPLIDASVFAECGNLNGIDCYVSEESYAIYKKTNVWCLFNLHIETSPTVINNTSIDHQKATKLLQEGNIYIIMPNGKKYSIIGNFIE